MANEKILNTRILLKTDTLEAWNSSTLPLKKGEIAIATVAATAGNGLTEPVCMIKIGEDGVKTFKDLPWNFYAKASDVIAEAKSAETLEAFVNKVIADAGIASDDAMEALAGRVTTVESDLNAATTGLKARVTTAEAAIDALEELTGGKKVSDAINEAITALNLATTYAAKVHTHEIADVNGLSDAIAAAKKAGTDANSALEAYKTLNDAAVQVNSDAIAAIKNGETLDNFKEVEEALAGKQAVGDYATKAEAQGYANAKDAAIQAAHKAGTDAAAAAAQALVDAKAYTDGFTGGKTVSDSINTALANYTTTTDMNTAIATAKGEAVSHADDLNTAMDARVKAVEGKAHAHSFVESELNLIKAGDVEKWNAAEKNAKDYADGLDKAMDSRVDALEAKFGTGEGNVDSKIAAAVAAEAEIARAAEQANAKAITDLTNGAVKDNADAIDALETLVGGTAVAEQIENALKIEVDGAKVEKYALATALAAEAETARAAEKANADAIKVLNGNAETAGSVDYKVAQAVAAIMENPDETMNSINELVTWVNDHASDALEMSNQVAANKSALEVLNGDATKAGSVDKKIADAIAAENLGQYATDGELSALAGRVTTVEGDLNTEKTGLKARMTQAEADIDALEALVGDDKVSDAIDAAIDAALKIDGVDKYALASALTAAIARIAQNETDIDALEANKANDADLAAVAKSGLIDDLSIGEGTVLVFDCGSSAV